MGSAGMNNKIGHKLPTVPQLVSWISEPSTEWWSHASHKDIFNWNLAIYLLKVNPPQNSRPKLKSKQPGHLGERCWHVFWNQTCSQQLETSQLFAASRDITAMSCWKFATSQQFHSFFKSCFFYNIHDKRDKQVSQMYKQTLGMKNFLSIWSTDIFFMWQDCVWFLHASQWDISKPMWRLFLERCSADEKSHVIDAGIDVSSESSACQQRSFPALPNNVLHLRPCYKEIFLSGFGQNFGPKIWLLATEKKKNTSGFSWVIFPKWPEISGENYPPKQE